MENPFLEQLDTGNAEVFKRTLEELHYFDEETVESLGAAAAVLVSIVVMIATQGAGAALMASAFGTSAGAVAGTTAAILNAGANAMISGLASQFTVSLIWPMIKERQTGRHL